MWQRFRFSLLKSSVTAESDQPGPPSTSQSPAVLASPPLEENVQMCDTPSTAPLSENALSGSSTPAPELPEPLEPKKRPARLSALSRALTAVSLSPAPSPSPLPMLSSPLTAASSPLPAPVARVDGKGKAKAAPERRVLPARIRRAAAGGAEGIRELEEMIVDWLERYGDVNSAPPKALAVQITTLSRDMISDCYVVENHMPKAGPSRGAIRQAMIETPSWTKVQPGEDDRDEAKLELIAGPLSSPKRSLRRVVTDEPQEDTSDAFYESLHRKYEIMERRQRFRERDKLVFERYKMRSRVELLKTLPAPQWASVLAAILSRSDGGAWARGRARLAVEGGDWLRRRLIREGREVLSRYDQLLPNDQKRQRPLMAGSSPSASSMSPPPSRRQGREKTRLQSVTAERSVPRGKKRPLPSEDGYSTDSSLSDISPPPPSPPRSRGLPKARPSLPRQEAKRPVPGREGSRRGLRSQPDDIKLPGRLPTLRLRISPSPTAPPPAGTPPKPKRISVVALPSRPPPVLPSLGAKGARFYKAPGARRHDLPARASPRLRIPRRALQALHDAESTVKDEPGLQEADDVVKHEDDEQTEAQSHLSQTSQPPTVEPQDPVQVDPEARPPEALQWVQADGEPPTLAQATTPTEQAGGEVEVRAEDGTVSEEAVQKGPAMAAESVDETPEQKAMVERGGEVGPTAYMEAEDDSIDDQPSTVDMPLQDSIAMEEELLNDPPQRRDSPVVAATVEKATGSQTFDTVKPATDLKRRTRASIGRKETKEDQKSPYNMRKRSALEEDPADDAKPPPRRTRASIGKPAEDGPRPKRGSVVQPEAADDEKTATAARSLRHANGTRQSVLEPQESSPSDEMVPRLTRLRGRKEVAMPAKANPPVVTPARHLTPEKAPEVEAQPSLAETGLRHTLPSGATDRDHEDASSTLQAADQVDKGGRHDAGLAMLAQLAVPASPEQPRVVQDNRRWPDDGQPEAQPGRSRIMRGQDRPSVSHPAAHPGQRWNIGTEHRPLFPLPHSHAQLPHWQPNHPPQPRGPSPFQYVWPHAPPRFSGVHQAPGHVGQSFHQHHSPPPKWPSTPQSIHSPHMSPTQHQPLLPSSQLYYSTRAPWHPNAYEQRKSQSQWPGKYQQSPRQRSPTAPPYQDYKFSIHSPPPPLQAHGGQTAAAAQRLRVSNGLASDRTAPGYSPRSLSKDAVSVPIHQLVEPLQSKPQSTYPDTERRSAQPLHMVSNDGRFQRFEAVQVNGSQPHMSHPRVPSDERPGGTVNSSSDYEG